MISPDTITVLTDKLEDIKSIIDTLLADSKIIEENKQIMIAERQELEEAKKILKLLDQKQKTIDIDMLEIQKKTNELKEREINVGKEIAVDKERKARLDIMEDELRKDKERIKKYLKI
jgi:tRNA(Ser,Leu) C12 N-acetylase TAN1